VVDLAALRAAMVRMGGDPKKINPLVPCDLVIDHSVQVDFFGASSSLQDNIKLEFERNQERYQFLRWGQQAFNNFRVIPPATGIVHQVNLEYLAKGVLTKNGVAFPDSLVGTDSHTTMINDLGVVGWGVGGIEAEAVMLGQPIYMLTPEVVGFKLSGELREGTTATDLVLTVTQMLRKHGVVGKFVEFFGPGLDNMTLADRATLANMAPEYGATTGFFPVDAETLNYLRRTGRTDAEVDLVERYHKEQGLFRTAASPEPRFSSKLELNISTVEPSLAGPPVPASEDGVREIAGVGAEVLPAPRGQVAHRLDPSVVHGGDQPGAGLEAVDVVHADVEEVRRPGRAVELPLPRQAEPRMPAPRARRRHRLGLCHTCDGLRADRRGARGHRARNDREDRRDDCESTETPGHRRRYRPAPPIG